MMSVWVTGAKGFIGGHLVRELANAGYTVDGIGHGALEESDRKRIGLRLWINGEIDAANLDSLAASSGLPETVFHLAGGSSVALAIAHPFEDFSRTVLSTARLFEWLKAHARHSHVIVASSAAVYGAGHSGPIAEHAHLQPVSPYGHSKVMMEQLCRSYAFTYGIRSTMVRLFSVYGANLKKQLFWDVCSRLQNNEHELVLGGTGAEIRDWCEVRDVVRLLAMFSRSPQDEPFRVINGGSGRGTTVSEVVALLAEHWENVGFHFSGIVRPGDPFSLLAENSALSAMGFHWSVDPRQGIADYVRWFRDRDHG